MDFFLINFLISKSAAADTEGSEGQFGDDDSNKITLDQQLP